MLEKAVILTLKIAKSYYMSGKMSLLDYTCVVISYGYLQFVLCSALSREVSIQEYIYIYNKYKNLKPAW